MPEKDIEDYSKYVRTVESVYMMCRNKLGDSSVQDFAIEIMNKIEKGLK